MVVINHFVEKGVIQPMGFVTNQESVIATRDGLGDIVMNVSHIQDVRVIASTMFHGPVLTGEILTSEMQTNGVCGLLGHHAVKPVEMGFKGETGHVQEKMTKFLELASENPQ